MCVYVLNVCVSLCVCVRAVFVLHEWTPPCIHPHNHQHSDYYVCACYTVCVLYCVCYTACVLYCVCALSSSSLVVMQREHQRQRRQRFLASGEVGDVLPRLLWRTDREHDACVCVFKCVYVFKCVCVCSMFFHDFLGGRTESTMIVCV